jgi:thioredoxin-related protein
MRMETGTFLDGAVQEFISKYFVLLKYESGKDGEQFMRFNVRGTPSFVVLDADGNELSRIVGFQEPAQLIEQLESVRAEGTV